uniref:Uncharacterized protein n=1 Tax=Percolomonas cosmopolitus TaxID=63605 RepID=A0A7S1KUL5_9EUKA|mmetsp:Transcript_9702/g.36036  ORF Transcript_9702/g.36036 Transcript_9702/m.36036 type:complete len:1335 (+) Transcript_9702:220-4224(+)|eukprot:CAMPEP_0117438810 /NCGR_PEP_ID=MMETSP0759-20121206/2246_1 /TAXON_ID=63605 /ORGANISM="Percolomonas cosmopolitus, Strain WS" /LENGTH=1334 /DNA_ID=CAMNT_0005230515 /DNA_START=221 /DNA_END=4225 /DNA_ORIENTATION=+
MSPLPKISVLKQLHALLHTHFHTLGHAYKVLYLSPATRKKLVTCLDEIGDNEEDLKEWFDLYQKEHQEIVLKEQKEALERQKEALEKQKEQESETDDDTAASPSIPSTLPKKKIFSHIQFMDTIPFESTSSLDTSGKTPTKAQQRRIDEQNMWNKKMFNLLIYHFPEVDSAFLFQMLNRTPDWDSHDFRKWYFTNIFLKSFPEASSIGTILQTSNITNLKSNFAVNKLLSFYNMSILQMFDDLLPRSEEFHNHPQDLDIGMVPSMKVDSFDVQQEKRAEARQKNVFKLPPNSWIFSNDFPLRCLKAAEWEEYYPEICARLEKNLKMRMVTEWVRIAKSDLEAEGAGRLSVVDARIKFLKVVHPEVDWNKKMFAASTKSNQRWVHRAVEDIFPSLTIVEEKQMELVAHGGKSLFEADVFVEELQMAFEYQGEQHYHDIKAFFAPIEGQLRRDQLKSDAFAQHGITLIHVPYWWDKSVDSLKASINRLRPDLIEKPLNVEPIPLEPINMPKFVKKAAAMEPSSWNGRKDLTGWYWCEKYDGIRCISQEGKFFSKKGNEIVFPDWLADRILPHIQNMRYPIDSELTCSQGYELMTTLVRLARNFTFEDREWAKVKLQIFDIVDTTGTLSFEERQEELKKWHATIPDDAKQFLALVEYEKIESNEHLRAELDRVSVDDGGEGLIAVAADNLYQAGRSRNSLKIKKYYDMEALYMGNAPNAVAFEVELINGERCQARCSYGNYYRNPYVPGKTVLTLTYTHLHQSTGKPFKPMVLRERLDLSWAEIKDHYSRVQPDYIELHSIARTPPSMEEVIAKSPFVNCMKELLKECDKPPSSMSDEEIRSLVGSMMQQDPTGSYPTMDEKKGLSDLLSIQEGQLNQMIADARYHESPGAKVDDARRRIIELMQSQDNAPPTREQIDKISQLTDVTAYRLNLIVNEMLDPPGEVTEEKRSLIWRFIKDKDPFHLMDLKDLHHLKTQTNLNVSQVRRVIWFMKDRPGVLTDSKKERIKKFLKAHQQGATDEQLTELCEQTELNRMQVYTLLNSFKIRAEQKENGQLEEDNYLAALSSWLEERSFKHPTDLELSQWEHITGLPKEKLQREVNRLIETHGALNQEKKAEVLQWMIHHDFSRPNAEQLSFLQNRTNLRLEQIQELIEEIRAPPGKIEQESLAKIEDMIHSEEEKETLVESLQASTGLGLRQVQLLVSYSREGPGELDATRKQQVQERVRGVPQLTASLLDKVCEEFALSRFQIYKIYHEDGSFSTISEETKELVKEWLKGNEDLSEFSQEELDELLQETKLSPSQVYSIVENTSNLPGELSAETKTKVLEWMKTNVSEEL